MNEYLASTSRTPHYTREVIERGLQKFDGRALWLLLSLNHYGWRAHADLVHTLFAELPLADQDPAAHEIEHRTMAVFDHFFVLVDEIWRVLEAIRARRNGGDFLKAYCQGGFNLKSKYEELARLSPKDWAAILALPDEDAVRQVLAQSGAAEHEIAQRLTFLRDLPNLCVKNMQEVVGFFERPMLPEGREGYSIRDVNNQYRHGVRVFYEDCAPEESAWIPRSPLQGTTTVYGLDELDERSRKNTINILMDLPNTEDRAFFASVS